MSENKIILKPEEQPGGWKFDGKGLMTAGFVHEFGGELQASLVVAESLKMIHSEIAEKGGSDYLRCFEYKGIRYWAIDDKEYFTFLLPEEY